MASKSRNRLAVFLFRAIISGLILLVGVWLSNNSGSEDLGFIIGITGLIGGIIWSFKAFL